MKSQPTLGTQEGERISNVPPAPASVACLPSLHMPSQKTHRPQPRCQTGNDVKQQSCVGEDPTLPSGAAVPPLSTLSNPTSPISPPLVSMQSSAASTQKLWVLAAGVLVFHVLTSVLQEQIFHLPGFSNVLLMSFGDTLCTTVLVAAQLMWVWWRQTRRAPGTSGAEERVCLRTVVSSPQRGVSNLRSSTSLVCRQISETVRQIFCPSTVELLWYVRIALLMSCSLYLTNQTSLLLSYPLQVIFKSSKLLCMVVVRRWWMRADSADGKSVAESETNSENADAGQNSHPSKPQQPSEKRRKADENVVSFSSGRNVTTTVTMKEGAHTPRGQLSCRHYGSSAPPPDTPLVSDTSLKKFTATRMSASTTAAAGSASSPTSMPFPSPSSCNAETVLGSNQWRQGGEVSAASLPAAGKDGSVRAPTPHSAVSRLARRVTAAKNNSVKNSSCSKDCVKRSADKLLSVFCSLRHEGHYFVQYLQRSRGCVSSRQDGFLLLAVRTALHDAFCTCRGTTTVLRSCVHCLRAFLQDGELQACTIIVLGLILFTCASRMDGNGTLTVVPSRHVIDVEGERAALLAKPAHTVLTAATTVLHDATGNTDIVNVAAEATNNEDLLEETVAFLERHQHPHSTFVPTSAPTKTLHYYWGVLADLYRLWFVMLVGVSGVMLSNLIDAVIYVLEEVYCFQTAGSTSVSSTSTATVNAQTQQTPASSSPPQFMEAGPLSARTANQAETQMINASGPSAEASVPISINNDNSGRHTSNGGISSPSATSQQPEALGIDIASPASFSSPSPLPRSPPPPQRIPASSQEVVLMLNGIATFLYGGGLVIPWLVRHGVAAASQTFLLVPTITTTTAEAAATLETFPVFAFIVLIVLASATSLIGTLCLLAIVAEYTGVMAVIVTSMRKTLTILLSFVLYGRRFTSAHAIGLVGVMGGVVWNELLRRKRTGAT